MFQEVGEVFSWQTNARSIFVGDHLRGQLFTGEKSRTATHLINILGIYPFLRGRDWRDTVRFSRTERAADYRKQLHASPSFNLGRATETKHARQTRLYHTQPRHPVHHQFGNQKGTALQRRQGRGSIGRHRKVKSLRRYMARNRRLRDWAWPSLLS